MDETETASYGAKLFYCNTVHDINTQVAALCYVAPICRVEIVGEISYTGGLLDHNSVFQYYLLPVYYPIIDLHVCPIITCVSPIIVRVAQYHPCLPRYRPCTPPSSSVSPPTSSVSPIIAHVLPHYHQCLPHYRPCAPPG